MPERNSLLRRLEWFCVEFSAELTIRNVEKVVEVSNYPRSGFVALFTGSSAGRPGAAGDAGKHSCFG